MPNSHNEIFQLLFSALGVLPKFTDDHDENPETRAVITLAQLGNNENLLQAQYVGNSDAPVRIYTGDASVILPIVMDLMNDTVALVAADDSKLVYEAIQFLIQGYTLSQTESQNPCPTHCSECSDEPDMVHRPPHYQLPGLDGLEVMDVRSSLLQTIPKGTPYEVVTSWNESWTYLTRMWGKGGLQDAEKALVYLQRMIDLWKGNNT